MIENKEFKIEKDNNNEWKLDFFSKLAKYESLEEIIKSDASLSNAFISTSGIKIMDDNGKSVYLEESSNRVKYNSSTKMEFKSGQINTSFLIEDNTPIVKGENTLLLKEYGNIEYQEFENGFKTTSFNLGENKGILLYKVEKNRAYFVTPSIIEDLKIISTNDKNKIFSRTSKTSIPKVIYDFGMSRNLNDIEIKEFVDNLSLDDVNGEQIVIYESNGIIKSLYIFIKSSPKTLVSRKIQIEL